MKNLIRSLAACVLVSFPCMSLAADMGTAFTYQGSLENPPGTVVTDNCDFRFGLWDAMTAGSQKGTSPQTKVGVPVSGGVFTVEDLDFGGPSIDGTARWLAIEVKCTGDAGYTLLAPRVKLSPAPHALTLPGLYTQQNATSPNLIGGYSGNGADAGVVAATISGGGSSNSTNRVSDDYCTIGGGAGNFAGDTYETTTNHPYATVGGGRGNWAYGLSSTVPGGELNVAGGDYSFAAGKAAHVRSADDTLDGNGDEGTFIWNDSNGSILYSTGPNQFLVRASGGTKIYSGFSVGVQLAPGGNSWSATSDRNLKENVTSIEARDVLARLIATPVTKWNLTSQDPSIRHIGPMAQDFYAAFGVGEMDTHISGSDADGVALAAIQGLYEVVREKDCEIEGLGSEMSNLKSEISELKILVAKLARQQNEGGK